MAARRRSGGGVGTSGGVKFQAQVAAVGALHQRLKDDEFDVESPNRQHGAWEST
jgi:hypothetical protein